MRIQIEGYSLNHIRNELYGINFTNVFIFNGRFRWYIHVRRNWIFFLDEGEIIVRQFLPSYLLTYGMDGYFQLIKMVIF